ncbi:hypothetical protein T08_15191, partial [Trichinella sp. T8]
LNGCSNWCACCQHRAVHPSIMWRRPLVIDRYDLHHEHEDHLLVGIAYVSSMCPRPHLRQQRQQKMKKSDLKTEEMDLVEFDDAYKCNYVIWFSIFRLLRTEDIMRLAYTSSEMNAMAQSYFNMT